MEDVKGTEDLATQPTGDTADQKGTEPEGGKLPGGDDVKDSTDSTEESDKGGLPGGSEKDADDTGTELKGAPEEYAEFDISAGKDIDYTMTEEQTTAFKSFGKENNLDDKQMAGVLNLDIERQKANRAANEKYIADKMEDGIKASQQKYGEKYDAAHQRSSAVFNKFFSKDAQNVLHDFSISSDPHFFDALNAISEVLSEDVMVVGEKTTQKVGSLKDRYAHLNKTK